MKLFNNLPRKTLLSTALAALIATAALSGGQALAQDDSSSGYSLRGVPIVRLINQERETPVVNNITNVTQQVGGAERVVTTVAYISGTYDQTYGTCQVGNTQYSAGWMLACGSRACVSFGYVGGYVSDVADPDAAVTCIR